MITPHNRMYINDYGSTAYTPAYGGFRSYIADIITLLAIILIVYFIFKRYRKNKDD